MGLFDTLKKKREEKEAAKEVKAGVKSAVAAKPVAAQSGAAKPVATQPTAAKPAAAQPAAAKPVAAKPVAAQPAAAKPAAARPVATQPATVHNTIAPTGRVQVVFGDTAIKFSEGAPYAEGNEVFVPIRGFANHIGAKISWDDATKTATLEKDGEKVSIVLGASTATVNGKTVPIGAPATMKDSYIFLPIKFLCDNLDAKYRYDPATKIATID